MRRKTLRLTSIWVMDREKQVEWAGYKYSQTDESLLTLALLLASSCFWISILADNSNNSSHFLRYCNLKKRRWVSASLCHESLKFNPWHRGIILIALSSCNQLAVLVAISVSPSLYTNKTTILFLFSWWHDQRLWIRSHFDSESDHSQLT